MHPHRPHRKPRPLSFACVCRPGFPSPASVPRLSCCPCPSPLLSLPRSLALGPPTLISKQNHPRLTHLSNPPPPPPPTLLSLAALNQTLSRDVHRIKGCPYSPFHSNQGTACHHSPMAPKSKEELEAYLGRRLEVGKVTPLAVIPHPTRTHTPFPARAGRRIYTPHYAGAATATATGCVPCHLFPCPVPSPPPSSNILSALCGRRCFGKATASGMWGWWNISTPPNRRQSSV